MTAHDNSSPANPEASNTPKPTLLETLWQNKAMLWTTIIAGFYLCGFLTLNAHLSKFGLIEAEISSNRYLLAASNYTFFLVCFYLFAGRGIALGRRWLARDMREINTTGSRNWNTVIFLDSITNQAFLICFSAAAYTSVAIAWRETVYFYCFIAIVFLILRLVDSFGWDQNYRKARLVLRLFLSLCAIAVFFITGDVNSTLSLFFFYLGIVAYLNLVLERFETSEATIDLVSFTIIYSIVFICTTAISFGAFVYGSISPKLGGGQPIQVRLVLTPEAQPALTKLVDYPISETLEGNLLYSTEKFFYVSAFDKTIRLRAGDVSLISLASSSDKLPFKRLSK